MGYYIPHHLIHISLRSQPHTSQNAKTPRARNHNNTPHPLFFLATDFPASNLQRPPVNGTLTCRTHTVLFTSRLVSVFPYWMRRGGVFLSLHHPFSVLCTPAMPFKNREKQREASRRHYAAHRDKVIEKAKEYSKAARDRIRAHIRAHLLQNPCVDCGETNTIVLEFDHIEAAGKKEFNISDAVRRGYGMKKIEAEIAKCKVRCANCHRKKTYERGGWKHHD